MTEPLASYTFLSWLRRGVSTAITTSIGPDSSAAVRATFPVTLNFKGGQRATANLGLYGPGEIVGIDARMIIRVYPRPDVFDAEPNYFPAIEFDQPDFPWRYTPAPPDRSTDRLRPWLALIVLADDEVLSPEAEEEPVVTPDQGSLPSIALAPHAPLPDLAQSWAWAHVQVDGLKEDESVDFNVVQQILDDEPHRATSRLLCPRWLKPRTTYTAYLVPSLELGRRAGLNEDIKSVGAMDPAWAAGQPPHRLPFYFKWRFGTGLAGDFESLVRQLRARDLPASIGIRPMDVRKPLPGSDIPKASDQTLGLEGALMSPAAHKQRHENERANNDWFSSRGLEQVRFRGALGKRLSQSARNLTDSNQDPILTPPIYAQWHSATDPMQFVPSRQPHARPTPVWLKRLNLDPRWRAVAGLGTHVVQEQQYQLLASAWEQVDGILQTNAAMRQSQLARETVTRMVRRHLDTLDRETFLLVTTQLHKHVLAGGRTRVTVDAHFKGSPVALGVMDPQLRRMARAFGPIRRRQRGPKQLRTAPWLTRMNEGAMRRLTFPTAALDKRPTTTLTGDQIRRSPLQGVGVAQRQRSSPLLESLARAGKLDQQVLVNVRNALADFIDYSTSASQPIARPVTADLLKLHGDVVNAIDPDTTITNRISSRLKVAPWVRWKPLDPLEPVMAAPEFDKPMYEPLRDLSQEWLLPGVGEIPANTMSLLATNPRFVESYMAGLNHEMARELLWHEYPTDQRGTYFRQFWDSRGLNEETRQVADQQTDRDIAPIHTWDAKAELGANSHAGSRTEDVGHLVLVIRGEVFRRYPNAMVYAVGGKWDQTIRKPDWGNMDRYAVFHGTLSPDLSFFGFLKDDLFNEERVRGDKNEGPGVDQGWYFVIQEQPTEPRFGLDAFRPQEEGRCITSWDQLSWGDLIPAGGDVNHITYIDLSAEYPRVECIRDEKDGEAGLGWHVQSKARTSADTLPKGRAADIAYITMQAPFRVAIHGSDMLPADGALEKRPFHA